MTETMNALAIVLLGGIYFNLIEIRELLIKIKEQNVSIVSTIEANAAPLEEIKDKNYDTI